MNQNPLFEQYQKIASYCEQLEDASYDSYDLYAPATAEAIQNWENTHHAKLPEGLKNWYLLSDGFDMNSTADILPLTSIIQYRYDDIELDTCFIVGHYIGDGSMLVIDGEGNFYKYDHGFCKLIPVQFEKFLTGWILEQLEDDMADAGLL